MSNQAVKIGIIGGSGIYKADFLKNAREVKTNTPFGEPSDVLIHGTMAGVDCVLLSRHGRKHQHSPTNLNYRANIWAMKEAGVTHLLATTACGSLREDMEPGDVVFLDQFIDFTKKRIDTFYDGMPDSPQGVFHMQMAHPFCRETTKILIETAKELSIKHHETGTMITEEGPRFNTKAENIMFQRWGADVINMTSSPEVALANEVGMCYSSVAFVTDYSGWKEHEVSVEAVFAVMKTVVHKVEKILENSIAKIATKDWSDILERKKEICRTALVQLQLHSKKY